MQAPPQVCVRRRVTASVLSTARVLAACAVAAVTIASTPSSALAQDPSCVGYPIRDQTTIAGVVKGNNLGIGGALGYESMGGVMELTYASDIELLGLRFVGADAIGDVSAPANLCWGVDLTSWSAANYSYADIAIGFGGVWEQSGLGAYAMPMIGIDSDLSFFSRGIGGGFVRMGPFYVGLESVFPLTGEADMVWNFRGGFAWGGDDRPTAASTPGTPTAATPTKVNEPPVAAQPATPVTPATPAAPVAGSMPYTLDDITAMVTNGVSTTRILELARRSCVSFRMTEDSETRLRRVGSDPELLLGLRSTCYSAP